jgi:hypothetical protein
MNLTHEVQSKFARVVLQRGFDFLEAALKMDRSTIEAAASTGHCTDENSRIITAWVRERVFDEVPVSKIKRPISTT